MRPLDGITVLALEHAISGPFCTRQLADLGARVIKVERPGTGDFARHYDERVHGLASHFVWCNRSKESLTLNLKSPEAAEILIKLLNISDVLVQNLAPGAAERLGVSYERLRNKNPKLIVCDISGYGSDGPYRAKKAYDLMIQGESGFLSITGSQKAPAKAGNSIADIAAGMYAYSNILAALIHRGKTGRGSRIDVSMLESMVEWMAYPLYYAFEDAGPPPRTGADHATIYPYGLFPSRDGRTVILGVQNEREWATFCEKVLNQPQLAIEPRFSSNSNRTANRQELSAIICEVFSKLSGEEVTERLSRAHIASAQLNDMHDVWEHSQLKARKRWVKIDTEAGLICSPLPPGISNQYSPRMDAVPALGEHTDVILRELGYDDGALSLLKTRQVI